MCPTLWLSVFLHVYNGGRNWRGFVEYIRHHYNYDETVTSQHNSLHYWRICNEPRVISQDFDIFETSLESNHELNKVELIWIAFRLSVDFKCPISPFCRLNITDISVTADRIEHLHWLILRFRICTRLWNGHDLSNIFHGWAKRLCLMHHTGDTVCVILN